MKEIIKFCEANNYDYRLETLSNGVERAVIETEAHLVEGIREKAQNKGFYTDATVYGIERDVAIYNKKGWEKYMKNLKKNVYLANAFSLQMMDVTTVSQAVTFKEISLEEAKETLAGGFTSAIGHSDTAAVVSSLLGIDVPNNRINISIDKDTTLIVAQLMGGRLPEGTTTLPEGFKLKFVMVEVC